MPTEKEPTKGGREKRFSLYPLPFEEAVRKLLKVKVDDKGRIIEKEDQAKADSAGGDEQKE